MLLDDRSLRAYVRELALFPRNDPVEIEPAGDGNINFVRRIRGPSSSVILKHARSRLEKFPEYAAPTERLLHEHAYGEVVGELAPEEALLLPHVLHFDPEARVLVLEDLSSCPRLQEELLAGRCPEEAFARLGQFLGKVHQATGRCSKQLEARFTNEEMRALHGEHIFSLPFAPNDFDVSAKLRAEAASLLTPSHRKRIGSLRESYYQSCTALVHADVQPANILLGRVPKLLDAEIAHVGDPAFDLGTLLAHLYLHAHLIGEEALRGADRAIVRAYVAAGGLEVDLARSRAYAGVEMLRRTLGAARVPAIETDGAAHGVLHRAAALLDE